jgi:hypothetical protein
MYACARVAAIMEGKMKDTRPVVSQRDRPRRPREARLLGPDGHPIGA